MSHSGDPDADARLARELRARGLDDAEIAATLRKKKRRRAIDYDLVDARARDLSAERGRTGKEGRRAARLRAARSDICTVEEVATELRLHPKTVQRFIREGRLVAERVGRSYRILRADVARFAGIPLTQPLAAPPVSVTAIIDIPAVDENGLRYWTRQFASRISGKRVDEGVARVELVHDPVGALLKIILVGTPAQTSDILGLIRLWQDQRE